MSVYDQQGKVFELKRGPIFANVVLADEINRTTPRTQSALLEAMSEGQVSIDDTTHELPRPFGFKVSVFPVKIARASGAWCRAVAILED